MARAIGFRSTARRDLEGKIVLIPYWLLFAMWAAGALQVERHRAQPLPYIYFVVACAVTTVMIGLRFEVGGDWYNYMRLYNSIYFLSLPAALTATDAGYGLLNWLAMQSDWGILFVNSVCAILFLSGFGYLCWRQPNPPLAVLVGVPYLIIVVGMGYTRQAAAIGIICFAIAEASEQRLFRLVALIGIAALMHKSAILMLPVALYPILRRNLLLGIIGLALFAILFILMLRSSTDALVQNYVRGNIDSDGALVRVSMNVLAGVTFLILRKRIELPPFQKSFWIACSILSILSLAALFSSSASSGVDRISLYLIPLQAVTYSRLPFILSRDRRLGLSSAVIGVIVYSFAVQFVWLNYATYANTWLPYKNAILTME